MTPQRSVRIDVGSDITVPIRTNLYVTLSRDPLGLDIVSQKVIDITIDYLKPVSEYGYTGSYSVTMIPQIGYTGSIGDSGSPGMSGYTGSRGENGSAGSPGTPGYSGSRGNTGTSGAPGNPGATGFTGSQGPSGNSGPNGVPGPSGFLGSRGNTGAQGFTGSRGVPGLTGVKGSSGPAGTLGFTGSAATSYGFIQVPGQTAITATQPETTVNIFAGNGISLTTRRDTIIINSTLVPVAANDNILINTGTGTTRTSTNLRYNNSNLSVIGNITATGTITASISDDRLKTRVGTITQPLDIIKQLSGFYYTNNAIAKSLGHTDDCVHIGLSAQEVNKVLPEAVAVSSENADYLTVKYHRLIPVLVEAIKAQDNKINALRKQAADLLTQVKKL